MAKDPLIGPGELSVEQHLALAEALGEQRGARGIINLCIASIRKLADEAEWNDDDEVSIQVANRLDFIANILERDREKLIYKLFPEQPEELSKAPGQKEATHGT